MGCFYEGLSKVASLIEYRRFKVLRTKDDKCIVVYNEEQHVFPDFERAKDWIDWIVREERGHENS